MIHILRGAGFHSTKPSVLDTLTNIAERHLLLLASTAAQYAMLSHNDPLPTISDMRMAFSECGVIHSLTDPSEEAWKERMRKPLTEIADVPQAGRQRQAAQKRKRDEEDTRDVREFTRWFDSAQHKEARRVAGMIPEASVGGVLPAVGVGGGVVQAEDFLTTLKKKHPKAGDESRLRGTVLSQLPDEKDVVIEGGPVQHIWEWNPNAGKILPSEGQNAGADEDDDDNSSLSSLAASTDQLDMMEVEQ
jgi:transcription initiation factor TFIID subunit 3